MGEHNRVELDARDWFRRFRKRYNDSAGTLLTDLGLFYDRHRKFVEYGRRSDPSQPEYTNEEWNRVIATLLSGLAAELGLAQAPERDGRPQLEWYLPGVTDRPTVVIRDTSNATNTILTEDLVDLTHQGSDLSVLLVYPDYPCPEGTSSIEDATRAWRNRIEARLMELQPQRPVLAMMISAYSFDVPAPWQGFVWNPASSSLEVAT